MFSSAAQSEDNYSVSAEWMFDVPCVFVQFGHDTSQSLPSTVTVNTKGGTNSRVLEIHWQSYDQEEFIFSLEFKTQPMSHNRLTRIMVSTNHCYTNTVRC
jgi:hypothetical protein